MSIFLFLIAFVLLTTSCITSNPESNQIEGNPPSSDIKAPTPPPLATPYTEFPTSGICAEASLEDTAKVEIWPDMPMPRCQEIHPNQQLQVMNNTDDLVEIKLDGYEGKLAPGEVYLIETPFGDYLAPGVHRLSTSIYRGPELVLLEE